jgi:hypothetical protein
MPDYWHECGGALTTRRTRWGVEWYCLVCGEQAGFRTNPVPIGDSGDDDATSAEVGESPSVDGEESG